MNEGSGVAATALFVEILVVGVGALSGLSILITGIWFPRGLENVPSLDGSILLGLGISLAYALGILVDRWADALLTKARHALRSQYFASDLEYAEARVKANATPSYALRAEYAKSRIRVCRGWMLNSVIISWSAIIFVARNEEIDHRLLAIIFCAVAGPLLGSAFFFAWRGMIDQGYKNTEQQAKP
ncbi:hypothetical protein [Streptomyces sp. SID3343]|uniref:hypothetical protein n=1 Tax=Streptomyces sp. SID3343 TaxID=2690260 RepID=UPI00136D7B0C|nr:hypothetical protein [Streptomyces sp. SID3343]MYW01538.1 hypothetical protein [Streptomyces sp. SID3343]